MLLPLLFAVQYSVLGVYSLRVSQGDTETCFNEAEYIECTEVFGRPSKCDCDDRSECYIPLEITRRPTFQPGEEVEYKYLVNNEEGQGPTIIAKFNTIVVVDVYNEMNETTSIHWHGMHQNSFPWFDGVGEVTQYPIQPFGRFRYIFRAFPQGTHWYHSHTGFQRETGLLGALIIRDEERRTPSGRIIDNPEEYTIILQESTFVDATKSTKTLYCLPDGSKVPVQFDRISLLMNGRHLPVRPTQRTQDQTLVSFVEPGKRYRFRIIAAMSSDIYAMSIENHEMHVIATDGFLVRKFTTDYLILHISERYDFIVKGRYDAQPGERFAIRVQTLAEQCDSPGSPAAIGYAYLEYRSTAFKSKTHVGRKRRHRRQNHKTVYTVLNCPMSNLPDGHFGEGTTTDCHDVTSLELLYPTDAEHLPSKNPSQEAFFDFLRSGAGALINGVVFKNPSTPLITNTGSETEDCHYGLECDTAGAVQCTHALYFGDDQGSARFVFSALGGEGHNAYNTHPIHMHGHSYFVAKVGYPTYNNIGQITQINGDLEVPDCGPGNWKNNIPPTDIFAVNNRTVRKDAIIVPSGGYVVVYLIADNPGYWFMHCHIDNHLVDGMAIALGENINCARDAPYKLLYPDAKDFCMTIDDFRYMEENPVCPALTKKKSRNGKKKKARKFDRNQDWMFQFEQKFQDERKFAKREE